MQATRQQIVGLLREQGEITVEELAAAIGLTQMAIRHHLNVLQSENLVVATRVRRQQSPGRPQQLYSLTEAADNLFPEDYYSLSRYLLEELQQSMGYQGTVSFMQQVAGRLALEAPAAKAGQGFDERLEQVAAFLTRNGFVSRWEKLDESYALHALTCPYRQMARTHREICELDKALIGQLLGVELRRTSCIVEGGDCCTYVLRITD
jgi:predicted ArsR family transcriptional regulator